MSATQARTSPTPDPPAPTVAPAAGAVWLGLLQGPSGYADEARGFLRALEAGGHAPAAREVIRDGGDARLDAEEARVLAAQLARPEPPRPVAVHHYAPAWARTTARVEGMPNVARAMFETDRLPAAWLGQLLDRDEVWVPSEHNRASFELGGVPAGRLRVIGGTLDFEQFAPGAQPLALDAVPDGHLVFLSSFEFSERKAWRALLAGWARAFDPADPVCLVLKTNCRGGEGQLRARVDAAVAEAARAAGRRHAAPVRLVTHTLAPRDLARLYAAADAYVLASRGEGWGRPYMEALAMGLPTIASRWSGNLEFMREETSWLVDGELVPVADDHGVFADVVRGHRWFEPDVDALAAALAEVASDPARARRRAAPARADLIERFGAEATAARLARALEDVADRHERLEAGGRAVALRGAFGRHSSLALVNDRLLRGLEAGGRRVLARPRGASAGDGPEPVVSHSWPPDFSAGAQGPALAILPWEYGDPPREWVQRAREELDRVVVPSAYVRDAYVAAGMPPGVVEVVPNGVDLDLFTPHGPVRPLPRRAGCVFLFVGGTIWRKGVDLLVEAWREAFGPEDDVLLAIKDFGTDTHYRGQTQGAAVRAAGRRADVAPIVHLEDHLEPGELPALYRAADVLVAPYRGEGFGLPVLEAMACGVPAIHTGAGPTREFVGEDGGWAVPAHRVGLEGRAGSTELAGEGYVHEVDVGALARTLRAVAGDAAGRRRRGERAAQRAQAYSWPAAAARLEEVLASLEAEGLPPARTAAPEPVDAGGRSVLYAPAWEDEATWAPVLATWVRAVPADAELTLVLPVPDAGADEIATRVLARLAAEGHDPDGLPDLVLHRQHEPALAGLVAAVDAVLLDPAQAAARPPALCRRAARLLTLADLPGLAAEAVAEPVAPLAA